MVRRSGRVSVPDTLDGFVAVAGSGVGMGRGVVVVSIACAAVLLGVCTRDFMISTCYNLKYQDLKLAILIIHWQRKQFILSCLLRTHRMNDLSHIVFVSE
jgi:hypothetical protein